MPLPLNIETFEHPKLADGDGETLEQEMLQSNARGKCHFVLSVAVMNYS